jgi:hypothetical protein
MKKYEELKAILFDLENDFIKFYDKNNKAAGTRVRKGMQDLRTLAKTVRTEVSDIKNK